MSSFGFYCYLTWPLCYVWGDFGNLCSRSSASCDISRDPRALVHTIVETLIHHAFALADPTAAAAECGISTVTGTEEGGPYSGLQRDDSGSSSCYDLYQPTPHSADSPSVGGERALMPLGRKSFPGMEGGMNSVRGGEWEGSSSGTMSGSEGGENEDQERRRRMARVRGGDDDSNTDGMMMKRLTALRTRTERVDFFKWQSCFLSPRFTLSSFSGLCLGRRYLQFLIYMLT